ncbi:hypothetical protein HMPREF1870_01246 [Bacteroidales bacterium KA00344]|nr:hypothetical protein HMPREF1870_01246 [Bacteroidales bacterium KA00344]
MRAVVTSDKIGANVAMEALKNGMQRSGRQHSEHWFLVKKN